MNNLWQDIRYVFRSLKKQLRFTLSVVLTLAIGIGGGAAIFTIAYHVLLRSLPYDHADKLAVILARDLGSIETEPVTPADFFDWRSEARAFTSISAAEAWGPTLTGSGPAEKLIGLRVSGNLFETLGASARIGRTLRPEDESTAGGAVVVLGHSLWQTRFGGRDDILGQTLLLDGEIVTVVGVMPKGFVFPTFWVSGAELWAPLRITGERATHRFGSSLRVFGRLDEGVSLEQGRAEMETLSSRLALQYPATNSNRGAAVLSLHEMTVGAVRPALLTLAGAVTFLLLIACANVANLLISRAASRRREMALRAALGATRARLARLLLVEGLILALAAGAVGALLAGWSVQALVAVIPAASRSALPLGAGIEVNWVVAAMAFALSLAMAAVFAPVHSLQLSRMNFNSALREGTRGSSERGELPRRLLVVAEMALAVMLLAGAGLLIRSYDRLQQVESGFEPENLISAVVPVTGSSYGAPERKAPFYLELIERVRAIPGVRAAAAINHAPLAGDVWGTSFRVEGRPEPTPGEEPNAAYRVITPGYFQTMGVSIQRGRDFGVSDDADAPLVAIVNQTLAERIWPGENAVGRRVRSGRSGSASPLVTVVGVVSDVQQFNWARVNMEIYFPFVQDRDFSTRTSPPFAMTLMARSAGPAEEIVSAIRSTVSEMDPNIPLAHVTSMEQAIATALWRPRFSAALLTAFAACALLLAAVGVYGVLSYLVSRRTKEIGIRVALGARASDVIVMILRQGLGLAVLGVLVGWLGAWGLSQMLASLLHEVSAHDVVAFTAAPFILLIAAAAACASPAWRAAKVDPLQALRWD